MSRTVSPVLTVIVAGLVVLALSLVLSACGAPGPPAGESGEATVVTLAPGAERERVVPPPPPLPPLPFDAGNAMTELRAIEAFGIRQGGSEAEEAAAAYIAGRLTELVLGAHMDSKPPSPGANDNASGCGVLLDVARVLASQPVTATVEIVFFGTEEIVGGPDDHHLGSAYHVERMSAGEQANTAGMISVDMIAVGEAFHARTMLRGPQTLSDFVLAQAEATGVEMTFLKDSGRTGWSDHGPFELAGMPAVAINRRPDPAYHTADDTSGRIDPATLGETGQLVLDVVRALDRATLERLVER